MEKVNQHAFKKWCVQFYVNEKMLCKAIPYMLMDQNKAMYDVMNEFDIPFTINGYKKCAESIFEYCKNN